MDIQNKCCGNCNHFQDVIDEIAWRPQLSEFRSGDDVCVWHRHKNDGWTEITPDNVESLKHVEEKRIVIANKHNGSIFYRCLHDINGLDSMAKQGGYYYNILPELKIE